MYSVVTIAGNTALHIWKFLRKQVLRVIIIIKKFC